MNMTVNRKKIINYKDKLRKRKIMKFQLFLVTKYQAKIFCLWSKYNIQLKLLVKKVLFTVSINKIYLKFQMNMKMLNKTYMIRCKKNYNYLI